MFSWLHEDQLLRIQWRREQLQSMSNLVHA
jgi:hypothetical protein